MLSLWKDRLARLLRRNQDAPTVAVLKREGVQQEVRETVDYYAPHCDSSILHAPGKCQYCDLFPDWQAYREVARIAFTNELSENKAPCPSVWHRSPEIRDLWYGNVAKGGDDDET